MAALLMATVRAAARVATLLEGSATIQDQRERLVAVPTAGTVLLDDLTLLLGQREELGVEALEPVERPILKTSFSPGSASRSATDSFRHRSAGIRSDLSSSG
jgi:hypothetical protein